jgi:7-cyano-7-deazaguanine synthase in queuosine biosynthesis
MKEETAKYSYIFDAIYSGRSTVQILSPYESSYNAKIIVDDTKFLDRRIKTMEPLLADLVDIGVAVFQAERLSKLRNQHTRRSFYIRLPLRVPERFNQTPVFELLRDILHYFTDDIWEFDFVQRTEPGRVPELQTRFEGPQEQVEVALWSGGLDSLAGLFNRINMDTSAAYTLFSTGENRTMQGKQKKQFQQLRDIFPNKTIKLQQIPFRVLRTHVTKKIQKNNVPRSRGFLFLLLGAVCACLEGQNMLQVYENGVGAINLAGVKSSTGIDNSRSVSPLSLSYMSDLLSAILRSPFKFNNPFLFWTKACMCALPVQSQKYDLIRSTMSCDRRPRHPDSIQCGRCSSCLLRRQALLANGMEEREQDYVILSNPTIQGQEQKADGDFLHVMLHQIDVLRQCLNSDVPWNALVREYPELHRISCELSQDRESQQNLEQQLVHLYREYVAEWDKPGVRQTLRDGLLFPEEMGIVA